MATSEIAAVELDRVEFDLKVLRDNFAIEREYRLKAEKELAEALQLIERLKSIEYVAEPEAVQEAMSSTEYKSLSERMDLFAQNSGRRFVELSERIESLVHTIGNLRIVDGDL